MGTEMIRKGRTAAVFMKKFPRSLGYDPSRLDDEKLAMTAYAQPAVFTCSLCGVGSVSRTRIETDSPALFAGFFFG
jgi:hypothetical protein